jgi:hypothetical protein
MARQLREANQLQRRAIAEGIPIRLRKVGYR